MNEDFQTNAEDTSIVEFDEEFPTYKTGMERIEFIFKIMTHCWRTPNAFKDGPEIPSYPHRSKFDLSVLKYVDAKTKDLVYGYFRIKLSFKDTPNIPNELIDICVVYFFV